MRDVEGRLIRLFTPDKWDVMDSGCWEWNRFRRRGGYGAIGTRAGGDHIGAIASRVALRIKLGRPIAPNMLACHTCDNPPCVNPDHLYEGTIKDNTRDMIDRDRKSDGHLLGGLVTRVLTREQAEEIREKVASGAYQSDMSREYGICKQSVSLIVRGITYGFNGVDCRGDKSDLLSRRALRRYTEDQISEAKALVREGFTKAEVERKFGMSRGTMTRVMNETLYRGVA